MCRKIHGQPNPNGYSIIEFYKNCAPDGARPVRVAYFYCSRNPAEPEYASPVEILNCILKQLSILALLDANPGLIFTDALDECDLLRRHELLEALDNIITHSANLVKVFVSSRDDNDIVGRLDNSPNIYISASDNEEDIIRFVHWEVGRSILSKRLLGGLVSEEMRKKI